MQSKTVDRSLPEGWQWARLGDVCDVVNGYGFPEYLQGRIDLPYPLIKVSDMNREGAEIFVTTASHTIDETILKTIGGKVYPPGTVIFPKVGGALLTNKKRILGVQATFDNNVMGVVPKNVLSEWLYYWLLTIDLKTLSNVQALPSIKQSVVADLRIPLPPLGEQRRIASRLNEQLTAVESARKAAEEQLQAAWQLPSAYLRDVFESSEAKHWQSKFIGDLAETCSGSTPLRSRSDYYIDGTIPWVKTGELKDGIIYDSEEHITELALKESSLKLLPEKTLLIAMYGQGQTRGRTTIIAKPMTVNQACFAIMPNESFDTEFLQFWFRYSYDRLRKETEGRGGNQPNLNGQVLKKQRALLPPMDEQKSIAKSLKEELRQSKILQEKLESQLAEINRLPASLLREAFAGGI